MPSLSAMWVSKKLYYVLCRFDAGRAPTSLNNLVIQLRKVCNHPDLLESVFDGSCK